MTSLWPLAFSNCAAISFKGAAMPLPAITCSSAACALLLGVSASARQSRAAIAYATLFICDLPIRVFHCLPHHLLTLLVQDRESRAAGSSYSAGCVVSRRWASGGASADDAAMRWG